MLKKEVHWAFVLLAYLTLLSLSIIDNARGPAYPDILSSFSITASRGAYLFAWASLAGLIANATARFWLPRIEAVNASVLSLILMMAGSYLFGESIHHGAWMLDISSLVMGFGMGGANVAMNLLIARATPITSRRQFYAGLHSVYGLGSLSAPLLIALFISADGQWDGFFRWLSLLPLVIMMTALIFKKALVHESTDLKISRPKLTAPIGFYQRLAYGLVFGFYVASEIIVSSRLVIYLSSAHDIPLTQARFSLSCFFLALLTGRLLFTVIPLKGSSQRWLLSSCIMTILLYFFSKAFTPYLLALTGLTMSFFYPVAMDWLSKKFPDALEWMTASVLTSISVILIIMHLGFGIISDTLGIESAMMFVPIFQLLCFLLLCYLGKASST